jgi:Flp pilus assembly protein protease CpaA
MLSGNLIATGVITVLLIVGGIQDWRTRECSNWLTIPFLLAGLIMCTVNFVSNNDDAMGGVQVLIIMLLTIAAFNGWMGGADWKMIVGLFGLWPAAGFASLVFAAVRGAVVVIWSRNINKTFPGVTTYALATVLTFLWKLFTISPQLIKV